MVTFTVTVSWVLPSAVVVVPVAETGWIYAGAAVVLGAVFVWSVLDLRRHPDGLLEAMETLAPLAGRMAVEAIDRSVSPPLRRFERALAVHAPRPALATALATKGFLAGQPANVFGLTAAGRNALFLPRDFQLRDAGGTLHPQVGGQNPPASVSVGARIRLDIELLP